MVRRRRVKKGSVDGLIRGEMVSTACESYYQTHQTFLSIFVACSRTDDGENSISMIDAKIMSGKWVTTAQRIGGEKRMRLIMINIGLIASIFDSIFVF